MSNLLNTDPIMNFWATSFDVSPEEMTLPTFKLVKSGPYVDRYGDEYIYVFEDFYTGKRILAGTPRNLSQLSDPQAVGLGTVGFEMAFDDVDYLLPSMSQFKAVSCVHSIQRVQNSEARGFKDFFEKLSEDDRDTLDLTFENEVALGLYVCDVLVGVSRYAALRHAPSIVDITIVMDSDVRGRGYGLQLASALITEVLNKGLCPRYRVNKDLKSSASIAERLGFVKRFRVLTLKPNM